MAKHRDSRELKKIEQAQASQQHALAGELSSRYVEKYPNDHEGQWLNGLSLYFLTRNAAAKAQFKSLLADVSDVYRGAALTFLARISRDEGNSTDAEQYYSQAIIADARDADNYVEFGAMLLSSNRVSEAEEITRKGIEAEAMPEEDLYLFLGQLHRSKGEITEAFQCFHHVLDELDDEEVEAAIEDLEQAAAVQGIRLSSLDKSSVAEEKPQHQPGQMVANIQSEYFVKILSGEKKVDHRSLTDYWETRIDNAGEPPFHFRIINGMGKNAPELTVIVEKVLINQWDAEYELHLGEIIDVKNWDAEKQNQEEY